MKYEPFYLESRVKFQLEMFKYDEFEIPRVGFGVVLNIIAENTFQFSFKFNFETLLTAMT